MILKDVDVLPHGLINSPEAFGAGGEALLAYARWVRERIAELARQGYAPRLHFDVYGLLGAETGGDVAAMVRICERLVDACAPYAVQLESPIYGADARQHRSQALRRAAGGAGPQRHPRDDRRRRLVQHDRGRHRTFSDAGAADMVQIKMPDLGSLTNAVRGRFWRAARPACAVSSSADPAPRPT